jgi:hypothetical protein
MPIASIFMGCVLILFEASKITEQIINTHGHEKEISILGVIQTYNYH